MRRLLLFCGLLGLLLAARFAMAQQLYYVDLSNQTLAVPGRTFFVQQVADGRPNRALGIGHVLRGMGNVPHPADLRPSPALALQALCAAQLPARPTDQPVLAVIRALFVQENLTFTIEEARDDLALDFYLLDADGQAHFACSTAQTVASRGLETTARHGRQLAQALQAGLAQLAATSWAAAAARPALPVAEAIAGTASAPLPVLAAASHPAGIYRTLQDFQANTPNPAPALLLDTRPKAGKGWEGAYQYTPYVQRPDGSRGEELRGAWGFCDGQQLFIYYRKSYCLLVPHGQNFRFLGGSAPDPQAMTTGALLGGAMGGALAAASTSDLPTDYLLDVRTGHVAPLEAATISPPVAERPVRLFVYRPRNAKGPPAQLRLGAGQPVRELAAGDYLELVPLAGQPLQISPLPAAGLEVQLSVLPTAEAPIYLECRPAEAVPLRQVSDATGAAALNKLVN